MDLQRAMSIQLLDSPVKNGTIFSGKLMMFQLWQFKWAIDLPQTWQSKILYKMMFHGNRHPQMEDVLFPCLTSKGSIGYWLVVWTPFSILSAARVRHLGLMHTISAQPWKSGWMTDASSKLWYVYGWNSLGIASSTLLSVRAAANSYIADPRMSFRPFG